MAVDSKYLDLEGLRHFWGKAKTYLGTTLDNGYYTKTAIDDKVKLINQDITTKFNDANTKHEKELKGHNDNRTIHLPVDLGTQSGRILKTITGTSGALEVAWAASSVDYAATAGKTIKSMFVQVNGAAEKFSFNGSADTTVNFVASTNIELTKSGNDITIKNTYVHPTSPGWKHIPAGGALNNVLIWKADGEAQWAAKAPVAAYADKAGYTNNSFVLQFAGKTVEGTDKYTFNGSVAKAVNIKSSSGAITIGAAPGQIDLGVAWVGITGKPELAAKNHTHDMSQITSGILSLSQGGTGKKITKPKDLADAIISDLGNGSGVFTDSSTFVGSEGGNGTHYNFNASDMWKYINTKAYSKAETNAAIDSKIAAADAMIFKGTIGSTGASVTTLPANSKIGWTYKVVTRGTYAGHVCEVGDMLISLKDNAVPTTNADWACIQSNMDGIVTGPASATGDNFAMFDRNTGKVLKNSDYNWNHVITGVAGNDTATVTIKSGNPNNKYSVTVNNVAEAKHAASATNADSADLAGKVAKTLGFLTNGTLLYKYDGSVDRQINIKGGNNINVSGDTAGNFTIANTYEYIHPHGSGYKHIPPGGADGQVLKYNGSGTATWENVAWGEITGIPSAKPGTLGVAQTYKLHPTTPTVQAVSAATGRYYGVESDAAGQLFVNVPWTDTTYTLGKFGITAEAAEINTLDGININAGTIESRLTNIVAKHDNYVTNNNAAVNALTNRVQVLEDWKNTNGILKNSEIDTIFAQV